MIKFPGTNKNYCQHPWIYKERRDELLTADFFVYMDYGRNIGPTFFLGSVHKVGVNLLIIGDTGGLKEVSTPITRNRTLGRNRHQYKGWSLWVGIIG